jgi:hypothetical protein
LWRVFLFWIRVKHGPARGSAEDRNRPGRTSRA